MRIVHLSDTHLGHSEYSRFSPDSGTNQREADMYGVFREITDYVVESKPDLVVHAGDLFDSIRPSNRAIAEAMRQMARIAREDIPVVVIAGNHSTPRMSSTDTIFRVLEYLPGIRPVFGGRYEKVAVGDCAVHCIPHCYSDEDLKDGLKRLKPDPAFKYNVMVAHTAVRGTEEASWGEFKEQVIPDASLNPHFDYIALGHYHKFLKMAKNAYYCGSPERLSFREAGDDKGFLEVDLDSGSVTRKRTGAREMTVLEPIECGALSAAEIMKKLKAALPVNTEGAIIRAPFSNISRHVYRSLDVQYMRELAQGCLHFEPDFQWKAESSGDGSQTSAIGSLGEEFSAFIAGRNLPEKELEILRKEGGRYLAGDQ